MRGLSPRKRFGQNFLIREELAERIVEHCHLRARRRGGRDRPRRRRADPRIAAARAPAGRGREGPRAGRAAARGAGRAAAASRSSRATSSSSTWRRSRARTRSAKLVVVGNIPYNITTPILERLFEQRAAVRSAVLLVQKEYAERLAAAAGTPEYGSLTLFARYHALLEPLMTVRAAAFWPRPDVDSMLVRFLLREQPPVDVPDEALLFRIIRGSFQHAAQAAHQHARGERSASARSASAGVAAQGGRQPRAARRDAHARGVREAGQGRAPSRWSTTPPANSVARPPGRPALRARRTCSPTLCTATMNGCAKPGAELGAQVRDVRVDRAGRDAQLLVDAPDLLEQLLARHGAAAVLDQVLEQLELLERERHLLAALVHLARLEPHLDVAEGVDRRARRRRARTGPRWTSRLTRAISSLTPNGLVT